MRAGFLENGYEPFPVVAIGKHRDLSFYGNVDVTIKQLNSHTYCMNFYFVTLDEGNKNYEGVREVSDEVV